MDGSSIRVCMYETRETDGRNKVRERERERERKEMPDVLQWAGCVGGGVALMGFK